MPMLSPLGKSYTPKRSATHLVLAYTLVMHGRSVPDKFLVAFSLAGEQRLLVRSIAERLEQALGPSTVFFDEWFEHYIAGNDADIKLQDIYSDRCVLAVVCVSDHYGGKPWTRAEHEAIRSRLAKARTSGNPNDELGILPIRVGDGDVKGIPFTAIVPDVRARRPDEVAQLIIDRLHLITSDATVPAPHQPSPMTRHPTRHVFGVLLTLTFFAVGAWIVAPHLNGRREDNQQYERTSIARPRTPSVTPPIGAENTDANTKSTHAVEPTPVGGKGQRNRSSDGDRISKKAPISISSQARPSVISVRVLFDSEWTDAKFLMDGVPATPAYPFASFALTPGTHKIAAELPGRLVCEHNFTVPETGLDEEVIPICK